MEISQRPALALFRPLLLLLALNIILPTQALHFYLDGASASPKCFYEELPKDTLVVGEHQCQPNLRIYLLETILTDTLLKATMPLPNTTPSKATPTSQTQICPLP